MKTDFSVITQFDGAAESVKVILLYDTEVVKLCGPVVDWVGFFEARIPQRGGRGTKQLFGERRKPHLDEIS